MFAPYVLGTYIEKFSDVYIISMITTLSISILVFIIILYIIWKTEKIYSNSMNNNKKNNDIQLENTIKF
jgi:heme/copper-type cytochrome/quinol oxidase subunit 2